jgi:kinetochore protein Nuf2
LQNTKQDIVKTRARIVTSPEKLKQAISEMSNSLMSEKSSISSLSSKQRDLQARIDAMSVLEADIASCTKLMEECEMELMRVEEVTRKVGRHREALEGRQLEGKEVDVKEQQLLRQLANAEDKLARVRRTAVSKREAAQKQMVHIREEYNVMAKERAMRTQEMDKKKAMIEATEKKVLEPLPPDLCSFCAVFIRLDQVLIIDGGFTGEHGW